MTSLENKYAAAIEAKNNDINSFIWKGPKEDIGGQKIQREIRLVDATDDQLKEFFTHCMSMLYSNDLVNPGRFTLIQRIQEDREKCNTELFLRYLENTYLSDPSRSKFPRFLYLQETRKWLSRNSAEIPKTAYYDTPIAAVIENVPDEFSRLSIGMVQDGCLDNLGYLNKKPITLNFIISLGVWFNPDEMRDLLEKDPETGKNRDRLDVVRERLGLKNNVRMKIDQNGLNYNELRALLRLKSCRFSELTTDQLLVLRNKVLFRLEDSCALNAELWVEKLREIRMVADSRGLELAPTELDR